MESTTANIPSWLGVAASATLVLIAIAISWRERLGLGREVGIAAVRAVLQLAAVGALLLIVFDKGRLPAAFGWLAIMVVIAGTVAGRRASGIPQARSHAWWGIGVAVVATMGVLLLLGVIETTPRVVIPVGGMVVSTAMVTAGLALQRTAEVVADQRLQIEARLALGLSSREAFLQPYRTAVRTALTPAVDTTKVVGLISLPGAMTGLILAGVDPWDAIRYQIVVMYMLLGAAFMAAVLAARLAQRSLFDDAERLVPM
ncbi:MAG: iron export ABC transporter permease subunit FetB [Actinomycetes bacterium]